MLKYTNLHRLPMLSPVSERATRSETLWAVWSSQHNRYHFEESSEHHVLMNKDNSKSWKTVDSSIGWKMNEKQCEKKKEQQGLWKDLRCSEHCQPLWQRTKNWKTHSGRSKHGVDTHLVSLFFLIFQSIFPNFQYFS